MHHYPRKYAELLLSTTVVDTTTVVQTIIIHATHTVLVSGSPLFWYTTIYATLLLHDDHRQADL